MKIQKTDSIFPFVLRKIKTILVGLLAGLSFVLPAEILHQTTFRLGNGGWKTPSYWNGKIKRENGCMILESTKRSGREFVRMYTFQKQIGFYPGYRLRMTIDVKGTGKLTGGFLVYNFKDGKPSYLPCPAIEMTPEFKKQVCNATLKTLPRMVLPYIEITGPGKAEIRSVLTENVAGKGFFIRTESPMQIIRQPDRAAPVKFRSSKKNTPAAVVWVQGTKAVMREGKFDASGSLAVQPESGSDGDVRVSVAADGVSADSFIDFMPSAEYDRFNAEAKKVKTFSPKHILIIGDSLSDFYRGRNYVDKLFFWLNKYNPGKFTFHNAGVGGDLLPRVKQRLLGMEGGRKAYRQEMYSGLFSAKYDLVLVFLGQNDTYTGRAVNFEKPQTPQDQQKPLMTWLVGHLKKKTGARIVLVSPSPSNEKLFQERIAKNQGNIGIFGARKLVDAFDAMDRQVCKEMNLDYINILTPIRNHPDPAGLFVQDGVHLSCRGARFIAFELLKWFAAHNDKQ